MPKSKFDTNQIMKGFKALESVGAIKICNERLLAAINIVALEMNKHEKK